jgi:4-alpha-glucanotransferase
MTDAALRDLAVAAGIAPQWKDIYGRTHDVTIDTLREILKAQDLPALTAQQIAESHAMATALPAHLPPLITAQIGYPVHVPIPPTRYHLQLEDGRTFDGYAEAAPGGAAIPAILEAGLHKLLIGETETVIATAPRACPTVAAIIPGGRGYGISVQIYSLRREGDGGIGDFTALAQFARDAARQGAHCLAISPVHAQFSAEPGRFAPYAPSSRIALNVLHADVGDDAGWRAISAPLEQAPLISWHDSASARLRRLREIFEQQRNDSACMAEFAAFRARRGAPLEQHARFEALHAHFLAQDRQYWHWRNWPVSFRDPHGAAVDAFVRAHAKDVDFHAFAQFLADQGLAQAQHAAREAGMAVGLIADLAVGIDSGGSQSWGNPAEMLTGLTIGAPPDLLQPRGQNWGLTALSPRGMIMHGFAAFTDMLTVSLAHAGGVRIDHSMGLHRLWVMPEGAGANEGAYLHYPETDLLRLVALHADRHRAVVVAEDLGTLPEGFQYRLQQAGISGMRVLYFERDAAGRYTPPAQWPHQAAAMTTTHDLPTIAGWWSAHDLEWRAAMGMQEDAAEDAALRQIDRELLWNAMRESGAAQGDMPAASAPLVALDAAIAHTAGSACDLLILPVEDVLGSVEQPNIPGTVTEHPNWRRRLPGLAATLLDAPEVTARLRMVMHHRHRH